MLGLMQNVIENLVVNKDRMLKNLESSRGMVFSQGLLLKLVEKCGSREAAYRLVQRNAMAGWAGQGRFIDLVAADREITKYLTLVEIAECFDAKYYFRHVDKIYKRCLR